jgi:hypothetical protein
MVRKEKGVIKKGNGTSCTTLHHSLNSLDTDLAQPPPDLLPHDHQFPGVWMIVNSILLLLFYHCTSTNPRHSFSLKVMIQILHSLPETPCPMQDDQGSLLDWVDRDLQLYLNVSFPSLLRFLNEVFPFLIKDHLYSIHHSSDSSPPIFTALLFSPSPLLISSRPDSAVPEKPQTTNPRGRLVSQNSSNMRRFTTYDPRLGIATRSVNGQCLFLSIASTQGSKFMVFQQPSCSDCHLVRMKCSASHLCMPHDSFGKLSDQMIISRYLLQVSPEVCFERGLYLDLESWYSISVQAERL